MTTKFKVKFLQQYLTEIFGNDETSDPLLRCNLSQKTKFNLKKLGVSLQEEHKNATSAVRELFNESSEDVPLKEGETLKEGVLPQKRIKEEFKEKFQKEIKEIEEMVVSIDHPDFVEKDFIDRSTGEIVAGNTYYNLIDILLRWEEEPVEQAEQ